jgi:predicted Zn-dependent protease
VLFHTKSQLALKEKSEEELSARLATKDEQLALKEKSEEELSAQLALKEKSEEEMKEKLVRAERKAIRVNKFMRRIVVKEHKLEWIYIATNDQYARERLFKIGSSLV